jgi:arginase
MNDLKERFDLVLAYPQWQGSGRPENLARGAAAVAEVCTQFGPLAAVPLADEATSRGGVNRWRPILDQFRSAQRILGEERPRRILTAGGDCSCDIAVIDYLGQQYHDLTVIWVDAHLDANTPATSPSGNLHGMSVAAILGAAPEFLAELLGAPLHPHNFRYFSAKVGDEGDWFFQRDKDLKWLAPDERFLGPVHIHFDLDALDPIEFPHVAYPDGTLSKENGLSLVRSVAAAGALVGLTITEFAPADANAAQEGSDYVRYLCEAAAAV